MSAEVEAAKAALRKAMRARRAVLPEAERIVLAQAASRRLGALDAFGRARVLAGYQPVAGEMDPRPALAATESRGAVIAWPRVGDEKPRLRFHRITGPQDLAPGRFGILEPAATCTEVPLHEIECFLVPGVAFDPGGRRVGQGGGYYDELGALLRAASGRSSNVLVGLAYDFQIVDRCPASADDVPVDIVVTEKRTFTGVAVAR